MEMISITQLVILVLIILALFVQHKRHRSGEYEPIHYTKKQRLIWAGVIASPMFFIGISYGLLPFIILSLVIFWYIFAKKQFYKRRVINK
ncbi:hypothetical protein [Algibacillus agarilyticus]|uniref:hypothetical protein n=1 Tax=Algibacillus agarilyticus TaxID=2234133 RepID=UPI000DCFDF77|nr:hypothetical protein [Algibacillus agarilyticus]